jgi:hypothetical protein
MAPPSEPEIRALLSKNYSPAAVPKLEEYLDAVCKGEANYLFDAVRTLVKLYQLFPTSSSSRSNAKKNIGYACLLAVLHGDDNDLLALQYMIPTFAQKDEPCASVVKCSALLRACLYTEFWQTFTTSLLSNSDPVVQQMSKAAVPALQQSILAVLALSYKQAPMAVVLAATHLETAAALTKITNSPVIESVDADTVTFVSTHDNTKRQRVYQEGVSFQTVSALLQKMAQ